MTSTIDHTSTDQSPAGPATDDAQPSASGRSHGLDSRLANTRPQRERDFPLPSGRPDPLAHLTPDQVEEIGRRLDALHDAEMATLGASDAAYIRRVIRVQRSLEFGSRMVLVFSGWKPAWLLGTTALSLAKIIENMEIGHNILHGQWDWMRDPKIHSQTWEWDHPSPAKQWQESHNEGHHTYTNVLDMDNDLGYGILRVDDEQEWELRFLFQPIVNVLNAMFFEYGIAAYDLQLGEWLRGEVDDEWFKPRARGVAKKIAAQMVKDYVASPLVSGPNWRSTLTATWTANVVRNIWSNWVIMCGHFPDGVETFATESIEGETRGEWYLRQMVGSANIHGSWLMHVLTGNLSHQVEHHLFPDMPSNHLARISPAVQELMAEYGLTYVTGTFPEQLWNVQRKVLRLSLPPREPGRRRRDVVAAAAADAGRNLAHGLGARLRRVTARALGGTPEPGIA